MRDREEGNAVKVHALHVRVRVEGHIERDVPRLVDSEPGERAREEAHRLRNA